MDLDMFAKLDVRLSPTLPTLPHVRLELRVRREFIKPTNYMD